MFDASGFSGLLTGDFDNDSGSADSSSSVASDVGTVIESSTPLLLGIGELISNAVNGSSKTTPTQPPAGQLPSVTYKQSSGLASVPVWVWLLAGGVGLYAVARR